MLPNRNDLEQWGLDLPGLPSFRVARNQEGHSLNGAGGKLVSGAVVVWLRISQERTGPQAGIQRQQEDYLTIAPQLGVTDSLVFIDNDVSVRRWSLSGARRDGHGGPCWGVPRRRLAR
jgi:hypothetical protein